LAVKPTWREYTPAEGEKIIGIDPGMAFGTGTHPTTALCIQAIAGKLKSYEQHN
jgi:ribosomal protein L11 methyltransferase